MLGRKTKTEYLLINCGEDKLEELLQINAMRTKLVYLRYEEVGRGGLCYIRPKLDLVTSTYFIHSNRSATHSMNK